MVLDQKMKGHFLNLYHMALSDAEIETSELEILYKIAEERGINKSDIDMVVLSPDTVKFSAPETVLEKIETLYDFTRIIWADGKIDPNERRVMEMFCAKFGFKEENVPDIVQFLIEEVEKGVSMEEVLNIVSENL